MSEKKLICPICGMPTRCYMGNYRKDLLCASHANALKAGRIIKDDDGMFLNAETGEILNSMNNDETTNANARCIGCGLTAKPGYLFCSLCYKKYNEKKLLVEITNCKDVIILDDSYEGKFTCKDGHIVKSKAEMIIDDWLFDKGIPHAYEKRLPIDADEKHDLYPDFYLPGYKDDNDAIYIEFWGYNENNIKYTKSKNYKLKEYEKLKITVICLEEKDLMDVNASMERKLNFYKKGVINE